MTTKRFFYLVIGFLSLSGPAFAQDCDQEADRENLTLENLTATNEQPLILGQPKQQPRPSHVDEQEAVDVNAYRIRAGDTFVIAIYGEPESKREVTVNLAGSISYLFIDSHFVLGKTINQLRQELAEKLGTYYRYTTVLISSVAFNGNFYTIMGEIEEPGKKLICGNTTLLSALCEAGGFSLRSFRDRTVDFADLDHSFLSRKGKYVPVNFEALIKQGDLTQDVPLKEGDYIYINSSSVHKVFILGEVAGPTTIDFLRTISLAEAIAEAGGLSLRASSRVVVIRGSLACPKQYLIDINLILKGCAPDFLLKPGDIVYVPPEHFYHLKELVRLGVAAFVDTIASIAGAGAFSAIHPDAGNGNFSNFPFINGGGTHSSP